MQAYKLVPWRNQMQWIGLVFLAVAAIALVAWLYLSVSAKASIAGREIQEYQSLKTKTQQNIAALQTDLADISSSTEMAKRAKQLGFKELSADKFEYMVIPGYGGKPAAMLASDNAVFELPQSVVTAEFTQSLWDWAYLSYIEPALNR